MNELIGKKVLVTTNNWFFAPDGAEYRCVFGTLKAVHEAGKVLGFIPNRSHANWFIEVGDMIIMGCQVMYLVQTDTAELGDIETWNMKDGMVNKYTKPTSIYNTEK